MLKAKKKITQKEVQHDKFTTNYYSAQDWYSNNKKNVNLATGIITLLIIASIFYYNNLNANNETSSSELSKLTTFIDNNQYQQAINGVPEKNIRGLLSIVENDGSSSSGNLAKFYLANAYYSTGEFQTALDLYEDVDVDGDIIESSRLSGIAACNEALGNFNDAAKYYEKSSAYNKNDPSIAENLLKAGIMYGKSGDNYRATDLFERIKKDFTNSPEAREIDRYIAEYSPNKK